MLENHGLDGLLQVLLLLLGLEQPAKLGTGVVGLYRSLVRATIRQSCHVSRYYPL